MAADDYERRSKLFTDKLCEAESAARVLESRIADSQKQLDGARETINRLTGQVSSIIAGLGSIEAGIGAADRTLDGIIERLREIESRGSGSDGGNDGMEMGDTCE